MAGTIGLERQHRNTVEHRAKKYGDAARADPDFRVSARFSTDPDKFVANVAKALARRVKYRSDGGKVARGLVLDSDYKNRSFNHMHNQLLREGAKDGQLVYLWCRLWRRGSKNPNDRWAVVLEFDRYWTVADFEGEDLPASESPKARAKRFIRDAQEVAKDIGGDQGKRIRAWLRLAEDVGHPRMMSLWYYNPVAVREFVWASSDEQERMIRRGGGFPLDGQLEGQWQSGAPKWRVYPIKALMLRYFGSKVEAWSLKAMDEELGKGIYELMMAPGGKGAGGEKAVSEHVRKFRTELKKLGRTPGNLYYESDRNTTDRRSLLEKYG